MNIDKKIDSWKRSLIRRKSRKEKEWLSKSPRAETEDLFDEVGLNEMMATSVEKRLDKTKLNDFDGDGTG